MAMNNSEILFGGDPDAKLDTGMTVREAIFRCRKWWDDSGRKLMVQQKHHQRTFAKAAFATLDPDDDNYLPSGILAGLEWNLLDKREKLRLIKFWHHFFVRMQDVVGTPEHEYKFGQRGSIQ